MRKLGINQYDTMGKKVASYESISEAARKTGINTGNIWASANYIRYTAGGYVFRYSGTK